MNKLDAPKVLLAGVLGAAAMTILILLAPRVGLPDMNIGSLLGSAMRSDRATGWIVHFAIGAVLAWVYAAFFAARLPGRPATRGILFSVLPWAFGQLAVMPLVENRVFDRWLPAAIASLVVHLVYGSIVGYLCGKGETGQRPAPPRDAIV